MGESVEAVLEWLDAAADAARRARHDPADEKALHRFRVNARRVLAYAKAAGTAGVFPRKERKRLRRALRATGPWRDAHVESLWLAKYASGRDGDRGAAALAKTLRRLRASEADARDWWRGVEKSLKNLKRTARRGPGDREFAAGRAAAAEKGWRRLARRLSRLDRVSGRSALHEARVAAKKLRYLLECPGSVLKGLPSPSALRRLQTALGDVHDRDVISDDVAAAGRIGGLAAPSRAALSPLGRERRAALARAERDWKGLLERRRPLRGGREGSRPPRSTERVSRP